MKDGELTELEDLVNQRIIEGVAMYPTLYPSKDDPSLSQVFICLKTIPSRWRSKQKRPLESVIKSQTDNTQLFSKVKKTNNP